MIVVCAGRSRSGSTLLYNVVRLILKEFFGDAVYCSLYKYYNHNNALKHHVIKIHGYDKHLYNNADYVFSCDRPKNSQFESIKNHQLLMKGKKLSDFEIEKIIDNDYNRYKKWAKHKNFIKTFGFDELISDKEKVIKELCIIFELKLSNRLVNIINNINKIVLPNEGMDKITGLTAHHFTSENVNKRNKL